MDGLHPPFIIAWDYTRDLPQIRTQRGTHLIATIEQGGDEGTKIARLFMASPDVLASLKEVDAFRMQSLDMMPPEMRGAWMRAHAAIAKSES